MQIELSGRVTSMLVGNLNELGVSGPCPWDCTNYTPVLAAYHLLMCIPTYATYVQSATGVMRLHLKKSRLIYSLRHWVWIITNIL